MIETEEELARVYKAVEAVLKAQTVAEKLCIADGTIRHPRQLGYWDRTRPRAQAIVGTGPEEEQNDGHSSV